ncbi:MAG: hypothetical protein K9J17_12580 [Flavobacteriales bacterium]|nr:hypothetical protein [Flavobacteriales bacterium]
MKNLKKVLVVLLLFPMALFAQDNMQDAIYLKDGSIYRGVIIEQVPNVSYKIKSNDGNVFAVKVADVEKITKEKRAYPQGHGQWGHWGNMHPWHSDSTAFTPKKRGYFMEVQVLVENVQGGVRMVNGYKFGRMGYLGIGVGVDHVFSNPFNTKVNGLDKKEMAGMYLPLYLYHSADGPTHGRMTPFYAIEAGYAMAFKGMGKDKSVNVDDFGNRLKGGPIAGLGLGFKVQNRRNKGHFSLLFNVNYKRVNYERDVLFINTAGQAIGSVVKEDVAHLIIPGIRLGFGF